MKNKSTIIFISLMVFLANQSIAGSYSNGSKKSAAKTTLADPGEEDYDIKYLRFNLHLADTSIYISGDVSTTALVTAVSLSNYVFELDSLLHIDSAKVNGIPLSVTNAGFVKIG